MATLRCTQKLLKRLGITRPGEPEPVLNALGDWYANIFFTPQGHYLMLLSEHARLPLMMSARDLRSLPGRFLAQLEELLRVIDVPQHQIDRELHSMQPLAFGRTADRSLLGTLNDNVLLARHALDAGDRSTSEISRWLAEAPCLVLDGAFPIEKARALLANPRGFSVLDGRRR
ncbi:MAG: hypothetical protein R6X23_12490 [Acidimicrobiia bacterium]